MAIGEISIELVAKVGRLEKDLAQANRKLDTITRKMATDAERNLRLLQTAVVGLATGAFAHLIKSSIDTADQIQKLSIRLGASTEALSQYQLVAEKSGVTFDTLTTGLQRMTRRIAEVASTGKGEAAPALEALGLAASQLAGLKPEDQFEMIADAMAGVSDQGEKVRLAMKLFDTEGVALLQTMEGGAEAIRNVRDEADRLGLTLSRETADAAANFNDKLTELKYALQGLINEALPVIIPLLKTLADNFELVLGAIIAVAGARGVLLLIANINKLKLALASATVASRAFLGPLGIVVTVLGLGAAAYVEAQEAAEGYTETVQEATVAQREFNQQMQRLEVAKLLREFEQTGGSVDNFRQRLDQLWLTKEELNNRFSEVNESLEDQKKALEDAKTEWEEYQRKVEDTLDRFIPGRREVRELGEAIEFLNTAFRSGAIAPDEYSQAIRQVRIELAEARGFNIDFIETMMQWTPFAGMAGEAAQEVDKVSKAFRDVADAADEGIGSAIESIQSLADSILSGDLIGALGSIFTDPTFFGGGIVPEDGVGPPTPQTGLFGGDLGAFGAGASSVLGQIAQGAGTGQVAGSILGAVIGGIYGGAAGAQAGGAIGGAIGSLFDGDDEASSEIRFGAGSVTGPGGSFTRSASDDRLQTAFGDIFIRSGRDGFSQIQGQATGMLRNFFGALEEMLTPEQIQAIAADFPTLQNITAGQVQDGSILQPILNTVLSHMDPVVRSLVGYVDDVTQAMERFEAAMRLFDTVFQTDAVTDYAESLRLANRTWGQVVTEAAQDVFDITDNWQGTVSDMNNLTAAMDNLHRSAFQALAALDAASDAIENITASSVDQLRFLALGDDTAAQIEFLERRANQLAEQLATATDPEEIQRLVQQINQLTLQATQLNPTQSNIAESIEFLEQVESLAQERIQDIRDEVVSAYDEAVTDIRSIVQELAAAVAQSSETIAVGGRQVGRGGQQIQQAAAMIYQSARPATSGGASRAVSEVNA